MKRFWFNCGLGIRIFKTSQVILLLSQCSACLSPMYAYLPPPMLPSSLDSLCSGHGQRKEIKAVNILPKRQRRCPVCRLQRGFCPSISASHDTQMLPTEPLASLWPEVTVRFSSLTIFQGTPLISCAWGCHAPLLGKVSLRWHPECSHYTLHIRSPTQKHLCCLQRRCP